MTVDGHREAPGGLGKLLGVSFPLAERTSGREHLRQRAPHWEVAEWRTQESWSPGCTFISPKHSVEAEEPWT